MKNQIKKFLSDEAGAITTEQGLIAANIVILIIVFVIFKKPFS